MEEHDDYDSPWKEALERYFPDFMAFFFPTVAEQIDWDQPPVFLDKELREVVQDAEQGKRFVDKLVRITRLGGVEDWVHIHVEVQGSPEPGFAQRMFVYNYRLFDRYAQPIASLAVLADESPNWRPAGYSHAVFGCEISIRFPTAKLADFNGQLDALLEDPNPFALITAAHLLTQRTKGDNQARYEAKSLLLRLLYRRGWNKQRVIDLFAVLDWMMRLPKALDKQIWFEIERLEENKKMRYVTSVERFYIEKGVLQGRQEGRRQGLLEGESTLLKKLIQHRFGSLPEWVDDKLTAADETSLERWGKAVLTSPTLEAVFSETAPH